MKIYLKELKFPSTVHTYIKDITKEVEKAVKKVGAKFGSVVVNSKHTTLGVIINEVAEPHLLEDIVNHTKRHVHEDKRSTWCEDGNYPHPVGDYKHRCQDSPLRVDEIDEDYNAGRHIRALMYSHPSLTIPFQDGKLQLGKYQQVAIFEFDGRDGKGKNPKRIRTVQIWVYPADGLTII